MESRHLNRAGASIIIPSPPAPNAAFTLIELSIVLVIIGLIIGGILVGQDLVKSAETRATLAQVEKYNSAVNTFQNKYSGIPGDMLETAEIPFGLPTGGPSCDGHAAGYRNGDGLIDGYISPNTLYQGVGETELFWWDLSAAGFLDTAITNGGFPGSHVLCGNSVYATAVPSTQIGELLPLAKLGLGNYFYVYEVGGHNWFGLSAITGMGNNIASSTTITVTQAYNMDKKIDDGLPTTGNVVAVYINNSTTTTSTAPSGNPDTVSTCYNSSTLAYSTGVSNGSGPNCALSFKMQGAAR